MEMRQNATIMQNPCDIRVLLKRLRKGCKRCYKAAEELRTHPIGLP